MTGGGERGVSCLERAAGLDAPKGTGVNGPMCICLLPACHPSQYKCLVCLAQDVSSGVRIQPCCMLCCAVLCCLASCCADEDLDEVVGRRVGGAKAAAVRAYTASPGRKPPMSPGVLTRRRRWQGGARCRGGKGSSLRQCDNQGPSHSKPRQGTTNRPCKQATRSDLNIVPRFSRS
jgi:hypothetical protein